MKKPKRYVIIPLLMLCYLAVMAYVARQRLADGEYLYYFGVIGISLLIIIALYFSLKKKEKYRQQHEESMYGQYGEEQKASDSGAKTSADAGKTHADDSQSGDSPA